MVEPKSRLKSYNVGSNLQLRDGDLLIAQFFPPSRGVHVVKLILDIQGRLEFGEYILNPQASQEFRHRHLTLAEDDLAVLMRQLHDLAAAEEQIDLRSLDYDLDEYEERNRRLLRFRYRGEDISLHLPVSELFVDFALDPIAGQEYLERFRLAWETIERLTERARAEAN